MLPNRTLSAYGEGKKPIISGSPENGAVEEKIEQAMNDFDYAASGYRLDLAPGRIFYFFHDCERFWKYIRPVCRNV